MRQKPVHEFIPSGLAPKLAVEGDLGTLKKLDKAHCALVDAEAALIDAGATAAEWDRVFTVRERVRDWMREVILAPSFADDPIERFRALEFVAGVDGVVSPVMVHAARAFADAAERALARQAAEG